VQVKNRLPGPRTHVEHGAVAVFDATFPCNVGSHEMALADGLGIVGHGFLQTPDVFLGNHQHVGWALRINVLKGVNSIVFINFLGGYFAANDAAEQTIIHDTSSFQFAVRQATPLPAALGGSVRVIYSQTMLGG